MSTLKPMVPDETQESHIESILDAGWAGGALLAEGMGRGKTLIAVEVILRSNAKCVLIVCPRGTIRSWRATLERQGFKYPITKVETGKSFDDALADLKKGTAGAYIFTTEFFRTPKIDWMKFKKVDVCVVDEIHKFANRQGVGFKKLQKMRPAFRLGMSGTPWGNRVENMWAVTRWVFPQWAGGSFWRWAAEYLTSVTETIYIKGEPTDIERLTGEKVQGQYVSELPCFLRTPEKHPDIPPILYDQLYVDLTPRQRKMYDKFEQDAVIFINENPLIANIPITMRIRLRQMTLGSVTVDESGVVGYAEDMQSAKMDVLKEFLDGNPEPVLILTESRKYAEIVAKRLGSSARAWVGGLSEDAQTELVNGFGVEFNHLVAVTAALGAGVDGLQERCNTMVWMSRSEDPVLNEQTEARLQRRGQKKDHVVCIDIIANDTYDESILDSNYLKTKMVNSTMEKK